MELHHTIWIGTLIALSLTLVGCKASGTNSAPKQLASAPINFENTTEESIRQVIPAGTPVADAKRILEESGCECSMETKGSQDRLRCSHSHKQGVWVTWVWQIFGSIEDGKVVDLECKRSGIGP